MPKTPKNHAGCEHDKHPDYSHVLPRLNRIAGQVEGVKKMISAQRYCPDILTQLRAVRAAVNSIEASILESHLDSCVRTAFTSGNDKEREKKMAELKALYKKYND